MFFDSEGLYCYDFEGHLVWKRSLGKMAKGGMGYGMSPVLHGNLLILQVDKEGLGLTTTPEPPPPPAGADRLYGEDSFITALDKRTGEEVWRTGRNNRRSWSTPLLVSTADGMELIATGVEAIISYDPATGAELWRSKGVVSHPIPSAVASGDTIFVSAGSQSKHAMAIRLGTTETARILWEYDKGTAYVPSPILYGDYLYLLTDKGVITCLDAASGRVVYRSRVPVPATFMASPVAFDGKILFTSEDGDTFVLQAGAEPRFVTTNSIGEPVRASPALSHGQIFLRGEQHLFSVGEAPSPGCTSASARGYGGPAEASAKAGRAATLSLPGRGKSEQRLRLGLRKVRP